MDFDQANQCWNTSSSSVDRGFVAEANPDERSSNASTQKKRGGRKVCRETPKGGSRKVYEVRDPTKKSRIASDSREIAVVPRDVAAMNFSASVWLPRAESYSSTSSDDIHNAARSFSCSSFSSDIMSEFPAGKLPVENVSDASGMNLSGNNVDRDHGNIGFVDEEAMFNMPELVNSMAEGMLLTPPAMKRGFKWDDTDDDEYTYLDLWGNS